MSTRRVSCQYLLKRGAADNVANYNSENLRREVNALIKEIGQIKKNKGNADELIAKKAEMDKEVAALTVKANELVKKRDAKAFLLGNIVDKNSAVSTTEVCDLMGLKYES
jgi:seryl-tRNA synthetase